MWWHQPDSRNRAAFSWKMQGWFWSAAISATNRAAYVPVGAQTGRLFETKMFSASHRKFHDISRNGGNHDFNCTANRRVCHRRVCRKRHWQLRPHYVFRHEPFVYALHERFLLLLWRSSWLEFGEENDPGKRHFSVSGATMDLVSNGGPDVGHGWHLCKSTKNLQFVFCSRVQSNGSGEKDLQLQELSQVTNEQLRYAHMHVHKLCLSKR